MKRKFTYGGRKRPPIGAKTRENTAWHESGHAVVSEYFDMPMQFVTCEPIIVGGKSFLGYSMGIEPNPQQVYLVRAIYALMSTSAGVVCEWQRGTIPRDYFDPGDWEIVALGLKASGLPEEEAQSMLVSMLACTEEFLAWAWDVVEHVANELIKRGRIEGTELRQIVRERLGYIPEANQDQPFCRGLVTVPGTEGSTREPWLARMKMPAK